MILRITDSTGDTVVDTEQDIDLAQELFQKAQERHMWGKGLVGNEKEFIPTGVEFGQITHYDEVVMLPQQVGG